MTKQIMADIPQEGEITIKKEEENDNSLSSPDETNDTDETHSPEGDENTQDDPDKNKPFHEHPRWKKREEEWETRFNEQEKRHQDSIKEIRDEFGVQKKENAQQVDIPSWFGGDKEQWDAYRADRAKEQQETEDRTFNRVNSAKTAESKAIEKATSYMKSEVESIESDKTLNPKGEKIDPNKLVKFVMDNDLVDSNGNWNYKAGFRMMKSGTNFGTDANRKSIAGATTSESKAEQKPVNFKTSKDFQQNKPW